MRTRPLGQLKGEGRVGGGGGEILRCGHKTEFNCAECNFFESPHRVFWYFSPLFNQTLCVHCHGRKDASQRRATITACSDPCWTPVTLQNITCFNGTQRKAGQFPDLFALNMFKSHLNASHKLTNRLKVIDKCVVIQHFQYSCFKVLVNDGGYF